MAKRGGIKPIIVVAAGVILLGFFSKTGSASSDRSVIIKDTKLNVALAVSSEEQEKGLSGRSSLGEDEGMLFAYSKPEVPTFWMKGMQFPIDIIWIKDGKVVGFEEKVQDPGDYYLENSLPRYRPDSEVDRVLEVKSGWIKEHGVKKGDEVEYNF